MYTHLIVYMIHFPTILHKMLDFILQGLCRSRISNRPTNWVYSWKCTNEPDFQASHRFCMLLHSTFIAIFQNWWTYNGYPFLSLWPGLGTLGSPLSAEKTFHTVSWHCPGRSSTTLHCILYTLLCSHKLPSNVCW